MPGRDLLGIRGKNAVVTGSSRGVGRAVAVALASAGVNVAVNYLHDAAAAEEVAGLVRAEGVRAINVRADVRREDDAITLAERAADELGPVGILVNSAHGNISRTSLVDSSWDEHVSHLEGILKSAFNMSNALMNQMKDAGWGRIVNIGNNMVLQPVKGYSAYASAMASLTGFTRNLAAEAGPWGITANLVLPGFVRTGSMPNTNEAVRDAIKAATPLGRLSVPEDVAGAVLFFASELGRFVTGADLSVDGGRIMG
jgi:3-oxoacyl-[acyl-carrier protein] reductase